jgi:hypothetical protein
MKGLVLIISLSFFSQPGMRNGKITGIDAVYVTVKTKDAYVGMPKERLYIKDPKEGDSVWVTENGKISEGYRDSRMIKE